MRIAYYVPATLLRHQGIRRRTQATVDVWRKKGHVVHEMTAAAPPHRADPVSVWRWHRNQDASAARELAELVAAGDLDHVHARLFLPDRQWLRLAGHAPVSLEIHSLLSRAESRRDLSRVVLGAVTARALVRRADAGVFVTREMQQHRDYRGLTRSIALGNGVAERAALPAPGNDRPVLGMAVGTVGAWHGLDRFAALAQAIPDVRCVVVAPDALRPSLSAALGPAPVEVWGTDGSDDYDSAMAQLDAAVGTLSFDRIGLTEAAPLKVRDYVMLGIPTLLTYEDTNVGGADDRCLLRLDHAVSSRTEEISTWVHAVRGQRLADTTRLMVSIDVLERRRLELIEVDSPR